MKRGYISVHLHTGPGETLGRLRFSGNPSTEESTSSLSPDGDLAGGGSQEPCLLGTRLLESASQGWRAVSCYREKVNTAVPVRMGPPKASVIGQTVRLNYTYCVGAPSACLIERIFELQSHLLTITFFILQRSTFSLV